MPSGQAYSFAFGPLVAVLLIGLLVLILRWTFRRGASVVAAPARPGNESDYGLLVVVASPATYVEGEMLRRRLEQRSVRATLASTLDGPRLMVWPADEARARELLTSDR